ncbi:MAG: TonB-dependent receptor, partial [Sphingomonadales bacterium]
MKNKKYISTEATMHRLNPYNVTPDRGAIRHSPRHWLAGTCALACLATAMPAMAQPTAPQGTETRAMIEEVVVTARRRDESIQDVPLSVAAFSGEAVERARISNVTELTRIAPSFLSVPGQGGGRSLPSFAMRGISQQDLNILSDQAVAVYFGDIVAARPQGVNSTFYDIGTVEVLRGPQGTLFGKNTTGGAVIIRPNEPTDVLEGSASVTVGNIGTVNAQGFINIPISDRLAVRFAGSRLTDNGFVYDELLQRNVNDTDQFSGRASVLYNSPGGVESLTTYEYFHQDDGGTPVFLKHANPAGAFNAEGLRDTLGYRPIEDLFVEQQARGIHRIATGTPTFTKVETHTISNTTSFPVTDEILIKNIIGYRDVFSNDYNDMDGTSNSWFPQERYFSSDQFSEEFQVLGDHGRMNWIGGLYFFRESGQDMGKSAVLAPDPGNIEPGNVAGYPAASFSNTWVKGTNTSYAAFVQASYSLTDSLSLTAGGRYTRDKRKSTILNRRSDVCRFTLDLDGDPNTPEVLPPLDQCEFTVNETFSEPTYNVSLEYQLNDEKLVYIAHRHGYRSGGFSARPTTQEGLSTPYQPEKVDDVEIGFKGDWYMNDMFLRTNIAAYHARYTDIQRTLTNPNFAPVQTLIVNAAKARVQGIELDVLFKPVPELDLTAAYAYTDSKYKEYITPAGADLSSFPL